MVQATHFPDGAQTDARWSPDGKFIVCSAGNRLYLTNVEKETPDFGHSFPITKSYPTAPADIVWSHNGDVIAFNLPLDNQLQIFVAEPTAK